MLKKVLMLVLCVAICSCGISASASYEPEFDVWDGSVDTSWASEETYIIDSAADLAGLRNLVWGGNSFSGKPIRLAANIDLNNLNWKYGIGGRQNSTWATGTNLQFKGTFSGDGHIIKNLSINPNLPDASEHFQQNVADSVLDKNIALGLFGYNAAAAIGGITLENVNITFHNSQGDNGNNIVYQVGGLAGFSAYSTYTACSIKNISFNGGWSAYAYTPAYLNIGGLIGDIHSGSIHNSYVNGVDFTTMTSGRINSYAHKAGLTCVTNSGPTISNVYVVNMKYNKDKQTELWAGYSEYDMRNFDTVIMCRSNGEASYHSFNTNGKIYTDNYDHRREKDLLNGVDDPITATVFNESSTFDKAQKDTTNYTVMVDLSEFGVKYPVTAAEKLFVTKAYIDNDGMLRFKSYNTTGKNQAFNTIIGKYNELHKLESADVHDVTLTKLVTANNAENWDVWNAWAYGKTDEDLENMNAFEGEINVNKGDSSVIKVFCWDSVNSLKPVGPIGVK